MNKEERRAYNKAWRKKNAAYFKEYYQEHKETMNAQSKKWYEDNQDDAKKWREEYRAIGRAEREQLKLEADFTPITSQLQQVEKPTVSGNAFFEEHKNEILAQIAKYKQPVRHADPVALKPERKSRKETSRDSQRRRRLEKLTGVKHTTPKQLQLKADSIKCAYCNTDEFKEGETLFYQSEEYSLNPRSYLVTDDFREKITDYVYSLELEDDALEKWVEPKEPEEELDEELGEYVED